MANCKKCGETLKKTSKILSVKTDTEAEKKGLQKNDIIISIDNEKINSKDDIEAFLKGNKSLDVSIDRQIECENFVEFLKGIEYSDDNSSLIVKTVGTNTATSNKRLQNDDLIISLNGKPVKNKQNFENILKEEKSGKLEINRRLKIENYENFSKEIELIEDESKLKIKTVKADANSENNVLINGDVIIKLDGKSVKNKQDLEKLFNEKKSCEVKIQNKEQSKSVKFDNSDTLIKDIEFTDEEVCSSCGAKQKSKLPLILISLLALIAIIVVIVVAIPKKEKETTAGSDFSDDNSPTFGTDYVGDDNNKSLNNSGLTVDINGNKVNITASGALTETEKSNNIDNLNKQLDKTNNDNYAFLDFDDSDPLFEETKVGSDSYRKMYSKNGNFDVRKPIISGYDFDNLTQDQLADIGQSKKEILGTVYFDYGYANWPKNAIVQTQKTTLGHIDFNKTRYTETVSAIKSLLSEIPQSAMGKTLVYVDGHTDHTSPHDFNQTLSEARAECIKEILIKNFGLNEKNIVTKGYSWDRLAVNTLNECAENRRVEISVVFFN